jgi:hypothetical protein
MSQTAKFAANPVLYATKRPLVIDDAALRVATAPGTLRTFATTVRYFEIGITATFPNAATVQFFNNAGGARRSCYLLPYFPGADVEIVVDNNADFFFTSNLSGCGVQVQPAAGGNVKVIHSNARDIYDNNGGGAAGAAAARAAIVARLQGYRAGIVGNVSRITKTTQEADFNAATGGPGFGGLVAMAGLAGIVKPTRSHARVQVGTLNIDVNSAALTGAFFGVNNGGWTFYSQVSSGVTGQEKKFFGLGKTVNLDLGALCVMGPPAQMWPDVTGTYTV